MPIETLTRPCVREVTPYFPGKPIAEVQRELGIKKVIKLASNENPLGASPKAIAEIRRALKDSALYPEGASPLLRQALAKELRLNDSQIIIGNGSDEIIRLLCEAFLSPEDEVVASQYGFIRFKQQAMMMGARVIEVPMKNWKHDLETMAKTVSPRTKLVFIASPNNPTGTYNTREQLARFLESISSSPIVILDEAYCHFAASRPDYPNSVREFLPRFPNLIVLRTFSKAYGLAGLRVGYGLGDSELIGWLDRIRMPFNVNLLAQRAAIEALKDGPFVRRSVALVNKNSRLLVRELGRWRFEVLDSAANFVFVKTPMPGRTLFKQLLHYGVIIRPLDEYGLPNHVRISIGTVEQNRMLLSALRSISAGGNGRR